MLPTTAEAAATAMAHAIIVPSRFVNSRAVAAGTMNMATTTIEPNDSKAVTAEAATNAINNRFTKFVRIPIVAAKPASIEVVGSTFQAARTNSNV